MTRAKLAGIELYFDDVPSATKFYRETLGFPLGRHGEGHRAKLEIGSQFLCLESKREDNDSAAAKTVVFVEIDDVRAVLERIGPRHITGIDLGVPQPWAAIRDPEGHTVVLLQA